VWNEDYEQLSAYEKGEFRRIANHLLSHTYLNKFTYQPSRQMTLPNRDYQLAARFFSLMEEYFSITGWRLDKDDIYGFMSLINIYDNNRYRMDQFTTLFLYTCRLIYEELREQASSFHTVLTSTHDIVQKMTTLGLLKKGKTTQEQRLTAQRTLAHFGIIEKVEATAWAPEGNRVIILPSIMAVVSNQGINDMMLELQEFQTDQQDEDSDGEYDGVHDDEHDGVHQDDSDIPDVDDDQEDTE
jgi:hypothetical protein